jgi:hypothetical protein
MENRGGAQIEWLLNKATKTIDLKSENSKKDSPIMVEIRAAIEELECVRKFFDTVDAPELIEYAIYREKAAITRLSYLIRKVKLEITSGSKI